MAGTTAETVLCKSERFAVRIIRLYRHLCAGHREYDLFRQLLRSGTSIGANLAEAEYAISRKDFLAKLSIALKECRETQYWLRLLYATAYLNAPGFQSIFNDSEEIRKILSSSTKTIADSLKANGSQSDV